MFEQIGLADLSFSEAVFAIHAVMRVLSHSLEDVQDPTAQGTEISRLILHTIKAREGSSIRLIPWNIRAIYAAELERIHMKRYRAEARIEVDRAQALLNELRLTRIDLS